jgi:hypothetical protein
MFKYKIYILLIFLLTLISINVIKAKNNELSLLGKVIYLDPGHPS